MMNIYKNDPKYKPKTKKLYVKKLTLLYSFEFSKSVRTTKHKITLFANS